MMTIRPLASGELERFARVVGRSQHAQDVQQYLERLLARGCTHLDWCVVLEESGQIIGAVIYWTLPAVGTPLDIVLLELPWERPDYLTLGTSLLQHALSQMQTLGASKHINHMLDMPPIAPQWQYFPEQRVNLLEKMGFLVGRETLRFIWSIDAPAPVIPERLTFRSLAEMGEATFLEAIERVSAQTFDREIQRQREQDGPAAAARTLFELVQQIGEVPVSWWQLAYTRAGELVGLVMPAANFTIGYIGVVPEQRGQGYIDDLLACGTATLAGSAPRNLEADTDVDNTPMANAFLRAGWSQVARRREYTLDLRAKALPQP